MRKLAVLSAVALTGWDPLAASTDAEARSRRNTGAVVRTYDDYDYVPAPGYRTTRVVRYAAPVTYDYGYAPARYAIPGAARPTAITAGRNVLMRDGSQRTVGPRGPSTA